MQDALGKRMKENYEQRTRTYLPRRTYTIIRLDGKAFHTFTRGLDKPYDLDFMDLMNVTCKYLCENIQGCKIGYVQSDEITLVLTDFDRISTDAWYDGQVQKMVSVAASIATYKFNKYMTLLVDMCEKHKFSDNDNRPKLALFDARVFTIADPTEVENSLIWRQKDAVRNSITMTAQSLYSHSELEFKNQNDMQEMIHAKGKNWNDIDEGFKRGRTYTKADGYWELSTPDFLKEREGFFQCLPKISDCE